MSSRSIVPEKRRGKLKEILANNRLSRAIEVHNGLSAIVGNDAYVENGSQERAEFDALWISSFTHSASRGQPDVEIVGKESVFDTISVITDVTSKPIIVDGDTGGDPNNFEYLVSRLERLGVSAVIIEDKVYPKRNSLDRDVKHELENPLAFANKIIRGRMSRLTDDFLVFARLESLIGGGTLEDAVLRAKIYLEAGADGIMIHSKKRSHDEIFAFSSEYERISKEIGLRKPLICVPTTYNSITEEELQKEGFNLIIYANHLLRSAHMSMRRTAESILTNRRSLEADPLCTTVEEIFDLVGYNEVKIKEKKFSLSKKVRVIIPAAGSHSNMGELCVDRPCALLPIGNKTVIEHQIAELKKHSVDDLVVIRGPHKTKIDIPGVRYYESDTSDNGILDSVFKAEEEFNTNLLIIYSDMLFNEDIIKKVLSEKDDIGVLIDNSYRLQGDKYRNKLDLVVTRLSSSEIRKLNKQDNYVLRIGKNIPLEQADAEFIGISYLSKKGAEYIRQLYHDCKRHPKSQFHGAPSLEKASLTDLLQETIRRGFNVKAISVTEGWRELHTPDDYEKALRDL